MGDTHGFHEAIQKCNRFVEPTDVILHVGDFGFSKRTVMEWNNIYPSVKCPVHAIGGNHEDYDVVDGWSKTEPTEVATGLYYIPRGYVTEMQGVRVGFLGGAESVDKSYRTTKGHFRDWWEQERIQEEDVERLIANVGAEPLDVLITHCPPPTTVLQNFPMLDTQSWGLPSNWVDISSKRVADAIRATNPRTVFSGHMHKSVLHQYTEHTMVRILDINEVTTLDIKARVF